MGSTTYSEYRNYFEKDRALCRRFQKIDIDEPSTENSIKILTGIKEFYEDFHNVEFEIDCFEEAVNLSKKYLVNQKLPDKAIDILDEAAASVKINSKRKSKLVSKQDIQNTISKIANIPENTVKSNDKVKLKNLERDLKTLIFGQDEAINVLSSAIKLSKIGLRNKDKPIGSFLFAGPTGVGKTELAKVIAKKSNVELIRLQCYEGIDINQAVYDWNYSKQIVSIRLNEMNQKEEINKVKLSDIYSAEYLIERPILSCIHLSSQQRPVLLIDEIDRADESFEAFLLEFLSEFAITIPEIGTLNCKNKPIVIITSNRTREINDALKRRCFYHWIDYPSKEIELAILENKVNDFSQKLAHEVLNFVNKLRNQDFKKKPGISETIDWYNGLTKLNLSSLDNEKLSESLGLLLKNYSDIEKFRNNNPDFLE